MLDVTAENGEVSITKMEGEEDTLISDIGSIACKAMLLSANDDATSAEEVFARYGMLARKLTAFIDLSVQRVNEMGTTG